MEYMHPGYRKAYPIATVLRDVASQEGCDGEPYDLMIAAAHEIARLQADRDTAWNDAIEAAAREADELADEVRRGHDYGERASVRIRALRKETK